MVEALRTEAKVKDEQAAVKLAQQVSARARAVINVLDSMEGRRDCRTGLHGIISPGEMPFLAAACSPSTGLEDLLCPVLLCCTCDVPSSSGRAAVRACAAAWPCAAATRPTGTGNGKVEGAWTVLK